VRKIAMQFLFLLLVLATIVRAPGKEAPHLEKTEWTDIWLADANQQGLPRVLLVGDSIALGYFKDVQQDLAGKAYCGRYTTSMFLGNPDYVGELELLLKRYNFSVIHINNGLHGWDYTEDQYRQSLPKVMKVLAKYGRGAVIVWATTTPRRNAQNPAQLADNNNRVLERNRIAADYMGRHGIAVDDLYNLVADHPEYYNLPQDATHFNPQGRAVEGKQVSDAILKALANRTSAASPGP
jgi:hypothetical protein